MSHRNSFDLCIQSDNVDLIQSVLQHELINPIVQVLRNCFRTEISVSDLTSELGYTSKFLLDNNLLDETPFFIEFNIDLYSNIITFELFDNRFLEYIEPVVLILSKKISHILAVECVLMRDFNVPIAYYKSGKLVDRFEKFNSDYFEFKAWEIRKTI